MAKKEKKTLGREILSWAVSIGAAALIALFLRTFVFSMIRVDGRSMLETLQNGDRLYVSILSAKIEGYDRGDVVIAYYPGGDHRVVKRIIGAPGDTVEIEDGTVYVNGTALDESAYITYRDSGHLDAMTLGDGEYFLMGDNRPVSRDSRDATVGAVTDLEGKVRFIVWPLYRFGKVE